MSKKNSLAKAITIIILVLVTAVVLFPLMSLEEGSFLYACLGEIHSIADRYANYLASDAALCRYGLYPLVLLALVWVILAFRKKNFFFFVFWAGVFAGSYLICAWLFGLNEYSYPVLSSLPDCVDIIGISLFSFSLIMLLVLGASSRKRKAAKTVKEESSEVQTVIAGSPADEVPEEEDSSSEVQDAPQMDEASSRDEMKLNAPQEFVSRLDSKRAMESLVSTTIPEFEKFQNYSSSDEVGKRNMNIYETAQLEAQIMAEEAAKRKMAEQKRLEEELERQRQKAIREEQERQEAEQQRQKLQNMFKPRSLMRRFAEDAQVEKNFASFEMTEDLSQIPRPAETRMESTPPQPAQTSRPSPIPGYEYDTSSAPVSQRGELGLRNQLSYQMPQQGYEPDVPYINLNVAPNHLQAEPAVMPVKKNVFQEEDENARILMAQQEEKRRREAEEKIIARAEARRKEEEDELRQRILDQAIQEKEQRLKALEEAEQQALAKQAMQMKQTVQEIETEDGSAEDDVIPEVNADEQKKPKGPDIDMVSGVGGLKSSYAGNSYLLDQQKFSYNFPPETLLKRYPVSTQTYADIESDPNGQIIVDTLRQFKINAELLDIQHGPTFTLYELSIPKGILVTKILPLDKNIAMELAVSDVRIMAPIPGKTAVGIEVPNKKRDVIGFDMMMQALHARKFKIPMVLGRTITGDSIVIDLAKTPHLLVAGTTGSGKSVCINGLICSVLYTKTPKDVRMILVDPKMVELSVYNGIPHLLTPVITEPKRALKAMEFVVGEMERRMELFKTIGAKKIEDYNERIVEKSLCRVKLPYIMVIIDEFADLMMVVGKELENYIKRITAVARFCGIHLVLATQRPSADVITGIIKSNIPTQIAFAVSNSTNSRIIIDSVGAEKLLGRGDMLYNSQENRAPERIQGAFIDSEIEDIVEFVKTQGEPDYIDESFFEENDDDEEEDGEDEMSQGELDMFSKAWQLVSDKGEASASYLQRRLGIGYNRAANLMEQLEDAGYIGPARGSKPREILRYYGSD